MLENAYNWVVLLVYQMQEHLSFILTVKTHYMTIQAVKAFHLKFKARLSWITAVLKIFAVEFNCVGNHFLEEFFSEIS